MKDLEATVKSLAEVPKKSDTPEIDIEDLRLSQDYPALAGVEKKITSIPVKKPSRQAFIRVRREEEYRLQTAVIEFKDGREIYVVHRDLQEELSIETRQIELFTATELHGPLFLWPVKLSTPGGSENSWNTSMMEGALEAMNRWTRMVSNRELKAYELLVAKAHYEDPEWPVLTFHEILNIAFKDRFIETLDHPVVKQLKGEV
jgi:hypothetical protein